MSANADMRTARAAQTRLAALANAETARHSQRFFKTSPGEYAEGDRFRGIRVPVLRQLARACAAMPLGETLKLLRSSFHEDRLVALVMRGSRATLHKLARSRSMWDRRVAMIATAHFIRSGESAEALRIAKSLLTDEHDLIHKAVGWMLREVGSRRDARELRAFLDEHATRMPRTMLRYAIEHLSVTERAHYMGVPRRKGA